MEMSPLPERALRTTDQLRRLALEGGHLLRMTSHIDLSCGHDFDALTASSNTPAVDRNYIAYANLGRDDRNLSGCCHNFHQMMALQPKIVRQHCHHCLQSQRVQAKASKHTDRTVPTV